ncbi:5-aminolevulic acid synthase [Roseicyclus persicicus]|uniref:5-aminolevulic acid synthase n=1 Tax=Roseicyclus persicicus TaxID=2650661 RepID=A0A7X6H2L0_9RHOB|nr:5-aminolevulic acid synthase [Roseibacterium persicicum]NKX46219.1 5-aminolevulic acid synthase [Roseibacterium persicicum]
MQQGTARQVWSALALALGLAAPAAAQELPGLREARDLVFAERGAIAWEVIPHESLTPEDLATLDQINRIQPQPYYAAMAIHPGSGLASDRSALAANYHDEDNARAAALAACGEGCVVVLVIRPEGWQPGRPLQLSAEATAALRGDYRALPRRARAMAISPSTGQWGIGADREAAVAACGAPDCRAVVEG